MYLLHRVTYLYWKLRERIAALRCWVFLIMGIKNMIFFSLYTIISALQRDLMYHNISGILSYKCLFLPEFGVRFYSFIGWTCYQRWYIILYYLYFVSQSCKSIYLQNKYSRISERLMYQFVYIFIRKRKDSQCTIRWFAIMVSSHGKVKERNPVRTMFSFPSDHIFQKQKVIWGSF